MCWNFLASRSVGLTCLPTDVNGILEGLLPRIARWPTWQPNQFAQAAVGCPACSTSRGQPLTWCDLWRKRPFEGEWRSIPGRTPSTGTHPTTGRGVSRRHPGWRRPPIFYSTGTNPRTDHWTACLCPVKDVADVTVEPPQENRERRKGEFSFCQPVALPRSNSQLRRCPARPHPPSLGALSGFLWPLAAPGTIPRTGFQVSPRDFLVTSR